MIFIECKPDEILVRALTKLPRKEVVHELKGKFEVVRQVSHRNSSVGMVDEDPAAIQPPYLARMRIEEDLREAGLRLLQDPNAQNRIVLLCPRLEEWIERAAKDAGVDLGRYGLPNDPIKLHRVINDDLGKFERLVEDLKNTDRLRSLRRFLTSRRG